MVTGLVMIKLITVGLALVFFLSACGDAADKTSNTSSEGKTALEKTISPQLDALEKAKEVEDVLNQSVEERDKMMRENGI